MNQAKFGTIVTPPGVFVSTHEKLAVDFLAMKRKTDITFILPDRRKGRKTADIQMEGKAWEIKSPSGKSSRTIENNLRLALTQSRYIILDLRRMDGRIPTKKHLAEVEKRFKDSKAILRCIVITREQDMIDFAR